MKSQAGGSFDARVVELHLLQDEDQRGFSLPFLTVYTNSALFSVAVNEGGRL